MASEVRRAHWFGKALTALQFVLTGLSLAVICWPDFRSTTGLALIIGSSTITVAAIEIRRSWQKGWLVMTPTQLFHSRARSHWGLATLSVVLGTVATSLMTMI